MRIVEVCCATAASHTSGADATENWSSKWCSTEKTWEKPTSSATFTCSSACQKPSDTDVSLHGRGTSISYKRPNFTVGARFSEWPGAESNRRHRDFQSRALPTELPGRGEESRLPASPPTVNGRKPGAARPGGRAAPVGRSGYELGGPEQVDGARTREVSRRVDERVVRRRDAEDAHQGSGHRRPAHGDSRGRRAGPDDR